MKNNLNFILSAAGFILAIFVCSFIKLGFTFFLFLFLLSIIILIYNKFFVSELLVKDQILLIGLFLIFFSVGVIRYEIKSNIQLDPNLEQNIGNKVAIEALIVDEPSRKESQSMIVVNFQKLVDSKGVLAVSGKAIISTSLYPEYNYGDIISISGKLNKPENFTSSSSKDFDYVSYLEKDDIFYKIDFAKVGLISSENGNPIKSFLFKVKNAFIRNINRVIAEPGASLLSGILLGAKSSIDKNTANIFRVAGLSHIVALSGYNITIVAEALIKALSVFPRTVGLFGAITGIILFVTASGASSTAVRAGIMSLIVILAQITRRDYQISRALIIAGLVMVFINPKILVFDISFQLSFLATIAIIYLSPILKEKFSFLSDKLGLRDIISATISAQILVLPLIIYKMGMFSLFALPTNILVLPVISLTMFFGFITGSVGFLFQLWSLPFGWISSILLTYIINVSEFFASLPFASINLTFFGRTAMVLCYALIAYYIINENNKNRLSKN